MSQRLRSNACNNILEYNNCDTCITRQIRREKLSGTKSTSPVVNQSKSKERSKPQTPLLTNQIAKSKQHGKQQNLPTPRVHSQENLTDGGQSIFTSESNEIGNLRSPRSRSSTAREPWSKLLKTSKDNTSLFSSFDPLRTLHFLAKELQFQIEATLPDDRNILQMVSDIQYALKRVPPEVASTIHLQTAIDQMLPKKKSTLCNRCSQYELPEKLSTHRSEKEVQTEPDENNEALQRIMVENTAKLEMSCRQLENLCTQLKFEREHLEKQLQVEKETVAFLKRRNDELEKGKNDLVNVKLDAAQQENRAWECKVEELEKTINKLVAEKLSLESQVKELTEKAQSNEFSQVNEFKSQVKEMKQMSSHLEKENIKMKHQIKLASIEKEKYLAILDLRDRQIREIRNEMTQLQEIVNEQLLELHSSALSAMPILEILPEDQKSDKETIGDTISSIQSSDDIQPNRQIYKDLDSGDDCPKENPKEAKKILHSHSTTRQMFDTLKSHAFKI